jgi:hypothetical protein
VCTKPMLDLTSSGLHFLVPATGGQPCMSSVGRLTPLMSELTPPPDKSRGLIHYSGDD